MKNHNDEVGVITLRYKHHEVYEALVHPDGTVKLYKHAEYVGEKLPSEDWREVRMPAPEYVLKDLASILKTNCYKHLFVA